MKIGYHHCGSMVELYLEEENDLCLGCGLVNKQIVRIVHYAKDELKQLVDNSIPELGEEDYKAL